MRKETGEQHPGILVHVALSHFRGVKMEKESDKKNNKETSSCSADFSHSKQRKPIEHNGHYKSSKAADVVCFTNYPFVEGVVIHHQLKH